MREDGRSGEIDGEALDAFPHCMALGMHIVSLESGAAVLALPYDEKLVGDPATGVIHGGAVTTLLDTTCGAAVLNSPKKPLSTATLDLRIDYMRPATPGETLFARAECHRMTRTVAFVRAVAYHDAPRQEVATAVAAFILENAPKEDGR